LTGWDIDILTPPEFQAGLARLDQTLKQVEGITQDMVDKVIALGLIDVRDIEEVGSGPLMEELGLDEQTAEKVVGRCADEAKIVAVEQEHKKAAQMAAKQGGAKALAEAAGRGVDGVAFANPLLPQTPEATVKPEDTALPTPDETADRMPGALEATEGAAPEIVTHKEEALAEGAELSPEEAAIQGVNGVQDQDADPDRKDYADEDTDTAALAEGRLAPPAPSQDEPV
jgi:hypothetical protein